MARRASMIDKALTFLRARDLQWLAGSIVFAVLTVTLYGSANAFGCQDDCAAGLFVVASILSHLALLLFLVAVGCLGTWIAAIIHRTYLQRLHLDALGNAKAEQISRIAQGKHEASPILAQARTYLFVGAAVGTISLLLFFPSLGAFGTDDLALGFALPVVAIALAACITAVIRGILLLRAGQRLLQNLKEQAGMVV